MYVKIEHLPKAGWLSFLASPVSLCPMALDKALHLPGPPLAICKTRGLF